MRWWTCVRAPSPPPRAITLDIDDTASYRAWPPAPAVFNAHYDERCFCRSTYNIPPPTIAPPTFSGPAKHPTERRCAGHLRRLIRRIRLHWPNAAITIRGDSHYGRREVMDRREANDVYYLSGLPGNAASGGPGLRQSRRGARPPPRHCDVACASYTETRDAAKSGSGCAGSWRALRPPARASMSCMSSPTSLMRPRSGLMNSRIAPGDRRKT